MKYIRTKDRIYELKDNCKYGDLIKTIGLDNFHSQDYEQSDNLAELCDVIVETKGHTGEWMHYQYTNFNEPTKKALLNDIIEQHFEVYYAIWTDKGLIYVAKMNEKGFLELI